MLNETQLDVKNLCSRKLWEILLIDKQQPLSGSQRTLVEQELITRQHYIRELKSLRINLH
jgi:hypothetical protein